MSDSESDARREQQSDQPDRLALPYTLLQHERLARLRAVETQRWVLRCGATGRTCLIAPSGKVVDALPLETAGALLGTLKIRDDLTLFTRYPRWFASLCWLASFGLLVPGRRPGRRR